MDPPEAAPEHAKNFEQFLEIQKLNNRKAPGYNLIATQVLKKMHRKVVVFLTTIYKCMLSLCYFPIVWKYAHIITIHKDSKPMQETHSYISRSLLPALSKIFQILLLKRIQDENDLTNILSNY